MKILHTSDLHANTTWFAWVTTQAPRYDLVVIAGDLIRQGFEGKPPHQKIIDHSLQIEPLKRWASDYAAATSTPIAISTGNHDVGTPETDKENALIAGEPLFHHLGTLGPQFILDGESRLVGELVVTVAPFHWEQDKERTQAAFMALLAGEVLASGRSPRHPWLLVHHRPPPGDLAKEGPIYPDPGLPIWLERFAIDFVSCGHDHDASSLSGMHVQKTGKAWCVNAGQEDAGGDAPIPCHAVIELETRTLSVVTHGGTRQTVYDL